MVVVPVAGDGLRSSGPPARMRQLLLIDPQPLFLAALGGLLAEPPLSAQVQVTATSDDILNWLNSVVFDLVLCDILAEPVPAMEIAAGLSRRSPPIPLILLGDPDEEDSLLAACSWPVSGIFSKDASIDEFLLGIEAVLAGHRAFGDRVMSSLFGRLNDQAGFPNGRGMASLSPTELDILTRVAHAQSITAIAATRGISHKTVRNHVTNICRKLQLRGRTEMMLCGARMGLTNRA